MEVAANEKFMVRWSEHMENSKVARDIECQEVKEARTTFPIEHDSMPISCRERVNWKTHLSFDFAQQLEWPQMVDQPGKFYFQSLRIFKFLAL